MARRIWTVARIQEIQRLIKEGLSDRTIASSLSCRRSRVQEIRKLGEEVISVFNQEPALSRPGWTESVAWPSVLEEIGQGFEIKRIWEERAASSTSYSNFWKHLSRHYPSFMQASVTLREFEPGTHCEVDWAGDTIPWKDLSGSLRKAHVFVGILCHSQLIFSYAFENEKRSSWLEGHQKMYRFFGGVPRITVPDNLKTGVKSAHRYDPDLNPAYSELAAHYQTAIVPARVYSPKDKALVENAVGLVTRMFRWVSRGRTFCSLEEINWILTQVMDRINTKTHTRLKASRRERWETVEKKELKPLPLTPFEEIEWKEARVHPDCTVSVEGAFYSVPHLHRGKLVKVKIAFRQVEVFVGLERVALHPRNRSRKGARVVDKNHLLANSLAYHEATPQNLLSQAKFLNADLHQLLEELFLKDALENLRRAQGLIRHAREEILRFGRGPAQTRIDEAVGFMRRYNKIRVSFFAEALKDLRTRNGESFLKDRVIERRPGNPMLRNVSAGEVAKDRLSFLLPEKERAVYELQSTEKQDDGDEAGRDGRSDGEDLRGGSQTGLQLGGGSGLASSGGGGLSEEEKNGVEDQVLSAQEVSRLRGF